MVKKLDVARIEKLRKKPIKENKRGLHRQRLQEDLACIKMGVSKLTVIEPKLSDSLGLVTKKLRVGAYVRISTQEEAQIGSFDMQIKHFYDEITENPSYELAKIYSDEGVSGTQVSKRVGFLEMIDNAKAGKLDLILTKSITRFGRNAADILSTLQLMKTLNPSVGVIFEADHIDTSDGKN